MPCPKNLQRYGPGEGPSESPLVRNVLPFQSLFAWLGMHATLDAFPANGMSFFQQSSPRFSITKPKFCVGRSLALLEGLPLPPFVRPFFPIRSASAIPFDTKMKAPSPFQPSSLAPRASTWTDQPPSLKLRSWVWPWARPALRDA